MSKTNPNQDYYKTGGRSQTDGPDRGQPRNEEDRQEFGRIEASTHPAVKKSAKKK